MKQSIKDVQQNRDVYPSAAVLSSESAFEFIHHFSNY
jgi:hypothetical protein